MSKGFKRLGISLAIIGIVLIGARIYINSILKEVIYDQVKSFSKNNYTLKVDKIHTGIIAFNATIDGFDLKHIPSADDSIKPYSNMKATSIRLRGLSLMKLVFGRTLNLRSFELVDPKIDLYYNSKFTDTVTTKAAVDLFTVQIKKLQLSNVEINLHSLGEGNTFIKAENLYYDIKTLNLEIEELILDQHKTDSSNLHFALNNGDVDGFFLNELFNKRTFHYSEIRFDKIVLNISKNNNTAAELSEKTEKIKDLTQSKFFTSIKPLHINELEFTMNKEDKKIAFKGNDLSYKNRDFSMNTFQIDIAQNFETQILSKQLTIKGMDADSINEGYNIAVNSLELLEPKIKLVLQKKVHTQDSDASLLSLFSIKKVNSLAIKKGTIELSNKEKKYMKASAKNIEVTAKNVLPGNGILYFENATFKANDMFFNMASNLYNFKAARINYTQSTGNALMSNFKLTPNHSKAAFGKIIGKQVARITLDVKTIAFQKFNILDIINRQTFACEKVNIQSLTAEFYKNKNIPLLATDYRKFPQELLREFGFGLKINTLQVKNSLLKVEVLSPNADNTGNIEVDQVNMVFKGVDNTASASNIELIFSGRLAKTGLINANVRMPVNDINCSHTAHIEIGKMPFRDLNKFINDVVHVSIARGQLDKAIVDIKGNKTEMNCKLALQYHDLEMKILADESTSKNENKLNWASKLANAIIMNSNPAPGKSLRISETKTSIEKNKFIINNWVAATLNSMLVTTAPDVINILNKTKARQKTSKNAPK